jgi:hypothetical protein
MHMITTVRIGISAALALSFLCSFGLSIEPRARSYRARGYQDGPCEVKLGPVCLRPESADLLAEVEQLYGKPVDYQETTKAAVGDSGVYRDGTPYVEVNPVMYRRSNLRQEAVVVHELFHLKMKANGYPIIRLERAGTSPDEYQFLLETVRLIFDPVEHHLFADQMREMGLDPDAEVEDHFRGLDPDQSTAGFTNPYQRAMTFMRVTLECAPETAARFERLYKLNGWGAQLQTGKQMAELVYSHKQYSPDDEVDVYLKCLGRLLQGQAAISRLGWETEMHGDVSYRIALIRVAHRRF